MYNALITLHSFICHSEDEVRRILLGYRRKILRFAQDDRKAQDDRVAQDDTLGEVKYQVLYI